MDGTTELRPDTRIEVVLVGGPRDLPAAARTVLVDAGQWTIKVLHRGGYEHFERHDAATSPAPIAFYWMARTLIAE